MGHFGQFSDKEGIPVQFPSLRIHEREEQVGIYSSTAQRVSSSGRKDLPYEMSQQG